MGFQQKSVVVTGGASGIGWAIASRFRREGARVAILDLNGEAAERAAASIGAIALAVDVSDEASVNSAIDSVAQRFAGIDIMVNNAGMIHVSPVVEMDVAAWRRLIDVNVTGVFLGSKAAARHMIAQGRGGVIINGSSGAGRRGSPNFAAYSASKFAVIGFSQALAGELARHRVRVNCYTPGHIQTPFWDTIAEGYARVTDSTRDAVIERFRASVPWGRFGTADEVANAVAWLASDEAEYVTGQAIGMNGGELPW